MNAVEFCFTSLLFLVVPSVLSLQCYDANQKFVDWYATYKAPELRGYSDLFRMGLANYYLDVNSPSWTLSKHPINASGTAVYNTLQQIYTSQDQGMFYIMYNDEHPESDQVYEGGHTKGVVAFDGKSGFWLIHSVPKFPPSKKDGFAFPNTGERYGQSFLCISLPYKMLGHVGKQLFFNEPHIYDYQAPQSVLKNFPVLQDVLHRKRPQGPVSYNIVNIQSIRGQNFTSFAKTTLFGRDLYAELVAPVLKDSILVETWMDGAGQIATNCSFKYKVYNVKDLVLPGKVIFKRSQDHSKWATGFTRHDLGPHEGRYWTCIGDINRMYSQFKRGGGTVCIYNQDLWKTFRQSVTRFENCNRTCEIPC